MTRKRNLAVHVYVDSKYKDVVLYVKHTGGLTAWIENNLDKVKIDQDLLESIKRVEYAQANK